MLSAEDDRVLAAAPFGTPGAVDLTVETGTKPVPAYVRISAPGLPSGETWFTRPFTESTSVFPLSRTATAQTLLTPLGLTYDPARAFARVTAFSCQPGQITINSSYSIDPASDEAAIYNGEGTAPTCVPSLTATSATCGGGVVPNAAPGSYTIRYAAGSNVMSAVVRLRAGVLTDVRLSP